MSNGPIARERAAHVVPPASTADNKRVCAVAGGRGYCGRSSAPRVADWAAVTCADCHAARRADEAVRV